VRAGQIRGARFRFDYRVEREGALVVEGWTQHACVDSETLRPTRVPEWLRDALSSAPSSSPSPPA
jgi:acyl-CoA thioesterase FadM